MSSSGPAEPAAGWLRLGDLAIGDSGVCVTSLIKDKIREYMLNEEQQQLQQTACTTTATAACSSDVAAACTTDVAAACTTDVAAACTTDVAAACTTDVAAACTTDVTVTTAASRKQAPAAAVSRPADGDSGGTCVRRIGNSLDLLLRESRNAGHAVAAAAGRKRPSSTPADDCTVSTTISAAADSSRPTADGPADPLPPPPPKFAYKCFPVASDVMQISRMPIPTDDCANSEMSVDASPSDSKSDQETEAKVNGDSHKKLNGSATVDDSTKTDEAPTVVVIKKEIEEEEKEDEEVGGEEEEHTRNEPDVQSIEPLANSTDEPVKNGTSEEEKSKVHVENSVTDETPNTDVDDRSDDNEVNDNEVKPMEIDETNDQSNENIVTIKKELEEKPDKPEVTDDLGTLETEKLNNGKANHSDVSRMPDDVLKNGDVDANSVNGEVKHSDDEKSIKSEKVSPKVPEEEDLSSEISVETLSPKQIDEPIARKRSATSHDDFNIVSGASSDNDLPKTKKLRSDDDTPILKDDTRERLIKNIVQSSGKNETELSRSIEKIQNEIKVITDIAQTKRDELVTLIRLQKLKEEIVERLMIKVKELDSMKTDNSKDWNLPEMFQINLSQPEHILSEKNITDIIDSRESHLEKSASTSYEQNSYAASSSSTTITQVTPSNVQPNDWILSERVNRSNRIQRPILPKPIAVNNQKEGRQGPILDVKLIIADHRSKNPETAVAKRGRRKATPNDFSVPTSSAPLRYPSPMSFGSPLHLPNDSSFKNTVINAHGVPNNVMEHGSEHNRFKDVPAFPEVTLHPVPQPMHPQQQQQQQPQQQQQQQQPTSLLHGILTKGTHHLPLSMSNPPTNYSPTLARLLTAPERCKQTRGKQRQTPAATVVSSNSQSRNEITITPVQSTSMSSTFQQKPNAAPNIPAPAQVDDEDASDRLVIDEGQDVLNANSPSSAPQCQGCMQKPAQFVCAGCGNQWYCSKDCQIDAWDEHSEICNG